MIFMMVNAAFGKSEPCRTMESLIWQDGLDMLAYPTVKSSEKQSRDAFQLPNVALSDNFALRWGSDLSLSENQQNTVLDYLELSWTSEITEQGYPQPEGSQDYLFNVYIGSSGSNSPSDSGVAGYYSTDVEGWPMIVIGQYLIESDDQYSTIPHEFFHAVQHSLNQFSYSGEAAWYWESTATWMENQVLEDDPNYSALLFGYAFLPHYSLSFFDYFDTGVLEEYHQYGAFIFPQFLSEKYDGTAWIKDSWVETHPYDEPLGFLTERMEEEGESLEDIFSDFAAHNAHWDYAHGEWYLYYLDYYSDGFSFEDSRIADDLHSSGTGDWTSSPAELPLEHLGYHHLRVMRPESDKMFLSFEGDEFGDQGTRSTWNIIAIIKEGENLTYQPISQDGWSDGVTIENLLGADSLILSVSVLGETKVDGEAFAYQYRLSGSKELHSGGVKNEVNGCNCQSTNGMNSLMLGTLLGVVLIRRKEEKQEFNVLRK